MSEVKVTIKKENWAVTATSDNQDFLEDAAKSFQSGIYGDAEIKKGSITINAGDDDVYYRSSDEYVHEIERIVYLRLDEFNKGQAKESESNREMLVAEVVYEVTNWNVNEIDGDIVENAKSLVADLESNYEYFNAALEEGNITVEDGEIVLKQPSRYTEDTDRHQGLCLYNLKGVEIENKGATTKYKMTTAGEESMISEERAIEIIGSREDFEIAKKSTSFVQDDVEIFFREI